MGLDESGYGEPELRLMIAGSGQIAQGLIKTKDYVSNVILLNLYSWGRGNGWHTCFDLENQFGLLAKDVGLQEQVVSLKKMGLIREGAARNTSMYQLTPLGTLVADKIEAYEMDHGYPATTQLISNLKGLYAPYTEIADSLDSILALVP